MRNTHGPCHVNTSKIWDYQLNAPLLILIVEDEKRGAGSRCRGVRSRVGGEEDTGFVGRVGSPRNGCGSSVSDPF